MAAAGESHLASDGGQGPVGCQEEKPGTLNPSLDDVLVRGESCGSAKHPGNVKWAEVGDPGDPLEREDIQPLP